MNSRLKIHRIFLLLLLMGALITPVIAASEGSGITGWILTTQDIQRLLPGHEVNNGEKQGNIVGFHVEGMYPWVNSYFSGGDVSLAGYTIISNKWLAFKRNSEGYGVKVINIDYSVFSYWDSPTRDQVMQRITGSMPFHQKYGSSKSIQLGNAGRAYITPVYDSATGNVYHIEFSKGYVYATLNVQIPKNQTGEALSIRIAEELEKKIPAATTIPSPTPVRASFTLSPQSGVAPLIVTFTDTSVGNPVSRLWKFHDGQIFTSNNVRFTYNTPGSYMVYLTVTGPDESTSTVTNTVKVLTPVTSIIPITTIIPVPPPVARIYASTTTGDAPLRVQFVDHSSGSISTRLWNFGDGYRSEISEPGHTFQKAGTYTVKLTVEGAGGSDTEILVINVGGPTIGPTVTSQVTTPVTPGPSVTEVIVTPTGTVTGVSMDGEDLNTGTKVADSTVAAAVAVVGAAAAAGVAAGAAAGAIPGAGGRPPGSSQDLQDEYRRLLDTIATEKASRDAWAREGKDSGRDGMISTLEEEAERRRKELEELGEIPDYKGRVEGPVGPSDMEKDLGNLEAQLKPIDTWISSEYYDLYKTELDLQKSLQEQRIRQVEWDAGRINTLTMVGGLSGTGSDALNIASFGLSGAGFDAMTDRSLGGLFNTRRPFRFLDNMRENYTAEHVRDMVLPIEETKTLIRAFKGDAEWHEVMGATSSGFLKIVTLGKISKGMMGETPVTSDIISKAIESDSITRANENIRIQKENLELLQGLKEKVTTVDRKKVMPMDETMEILSNPDKGRIMKNPTAEIPKDVREAYANTRKEVNAIHDAKLVEWGKENINGMKNADVAVLDFSTPGKDPLLTSVDRDYRLVEVLARDSNGKPVAYREIDPQLWRGKSQQTFAEITNAPEKVFASHYAETHQYEAVTKFDTQACRDYSDQIITPTGKIVTGEPNILKVKRGESLLEDPQGFSEMWKNKVSTASTNNEAVQQAGKCIEQYEGIREGTSKYFSNIGGTGKKMGRVIEPVQEQINAIKEFVKDPSSKEANVALAKNVPDINRFMEKMEGLIKALPRKPPGGM